MDPPRTGRHKNASLGGLIELLAPHVGAAELAGWQSELALLNAAVKPLRAVRDRFVAHEDLATALNYHPQPLPGFSRADVEALLYALRQTAEVMPSPFTRRQRCQGGLQSVIRALDVKYKNGPAHLRERALPPSNQKRM